MEICDKHDNTIQAEGHCWCAREDQSECAPGCQCVCHDSSKGFLIPWVDRRRIAFILTLDADTFAKYPLCSCINPESYKCGQRLLVHTHGCECVCHTYIDFGVSWLEAQAAAAGHYASAEQSSAPAFDHTAALYVAPAAPKYLGQQKAEFDGTLDLIEWQAREHITIYLKGNEFTSHCPVTDQPDYATISVQYTPSKWLVETKSFKLFLQSYRNRREYNEKLVVEIARTFYTQIQPRSVSVEMLFNQRGGISVSAYTQLPQFRSAGASGDEDLPF